MIERDFDIPLIASLALREKQIQQNYRPIIAVHKWFARRPGTLFRGLLLAEFGKEPLAETFFRGNRLEGLRVADPFMGGGTPLIEANRLGCDTVGYDINPMAYWIVRQEIEHLDLIAYREAAQALIRRLTEQVGSLYHTSCAECGSDEAHVKYFLWVKVQACVQCGTDIDLFPGYLLSADSRHPKNVFVCPGCGELTETGDRTLPGACGSCGKPLSTVGPAARNRCPCPACGQTNTYPAPHAGPPRHRLFAIEYHCPRCAPRHKGRFFKRPDVQDRARYAAATARWQQLQPELVPDDPIPAGDETDRLHRWGYTHYREMFNARQLLGLELSCREIARQPDERVRHALATNLSDLLRYQNMLCRYDTVALKSLDIFSVHGFPVGLIQCESNLLGIVKGSARIGSGGWSNIVEKYFKAKLYCDQPFEIRYQGGRKVEVPTVGEWIGEHRNGTRTAESRRVELCCESATRAVPPAHSLDAVLTDPPYFGNVQYAELMDFCYVWLRRLAAAGQACFAHPTTRHRDELTGNDTLERGLEHFTEGLSAVFEHMALALRPGAPLAFTYHHNALEAYQPLAVAILDAGLTCSATLPSPAEMSASIHINGTASSIIDTVFVCRGTGTVPRRWLAETAEAVAALVQEDLQRLRAGGVKPTLGDMRCITYGHLVRLAIWRLRKRWDRSRPVAARLRALADELRAFATAADVECCLSQDLADTPRIQRPAVREDGTGYGAVDEVSFSVPKASAPSPDRVFSMRCCCMSDPSAARLPDTVTR